MELLNEFTKIYEYKGILSHIELKHQTHLKADAKRQWITAMLPLKRWQLTPTRFNKLYQLSEEHLDFYQVHDMISHDIKEQINLLLIHQLNQFDNEIDYIDLNTLEFRSMFQSIFSICSKDLPNNKQSSHEMYYDAIDQYQYEINIGDKNALLLIQDTIYQFLHENASHPCISIYSGLLLYALLLKHEFNIVHYACVLTNMKNLIKHILHHQINEIECKTIMISSILNQYEKLYDMSQSNDQQSPAEKVLHVLSMNYEPLSRKTLQMNIPSISQKTIERALIELQRAKLIEKVGKGKSTKYQLI